MYYKRDDKVLLKEKFPENKDHFSGRGCEAFVIGSYASQYGGSNRDDYTLLILNDIEYGNPYTSSWYNTEDIEKLLQLRNGDLLLELEGLLEKEEQLYLEEDEEEELDED